MVRDVINIKFDGQGLIPAVIQDADNNQVLMVAYMNQESIDRTIETGITHFWSRTRQEIWQKGEISGNTQQVQEIYFDCDMDTLLIKVIQQGGACHTGHRSCFYKKMEPGSVNITESGDKVFDPNVVYGSSAVLQEVYDTILDRQENPKEGSYTNYLLDKGIDKILKKVGEESAEVIIAAKNRVEDEVVYEVADLLYHLLVTLVEQDITLDKVYEELEERR